MQYSWRGARTRTSSTCRAWSRARWWGMRIQRTRVILLAWQCRVEERQVKRSHYLRLSEQPLVRGEWRNRLPRQDRFMP